jgi:hypothetical protein
MPDTFPGAVIRAIAIWTRRQITPSPSTWAEGEESMPEITIVAKMKTDERGWPQIHFTPENDVLHSVAALLQEDLGVFLPTCDGLLAEIRQALLGVAEESTWNGDRFLLRLKRDRTSMTDMFGEAGVKSAPVMIETSLLGLIVDAWREFVSELPRQREFAGPVQDSSSA